MLNVGLILLDWAVKINAQDLVNSKQSTTRKNGLGSLAVDVCKYSGSDRVGK